MKEIFKKSFSWETLEPFLVGVGTVLLLEFLIFPGLTLNNTFINLLSGATLLWLIIFTITYLKTKFKLWKTKVTTKESNDNEENSNKKENKNESTTN